MIDLENQTKMKIELFKLEKIAHILSDREVELIVTDDKTMQKLNSEHRGKKSSTDVLSFPIEIPFTDTQQCVSDMPLGSIVVSENYVLKKAQELGHDVQDELSLLFIHGMLHLLGFDHEKDQGEMRSKEKELIEVFDLPKSLIVRTEED
ncbi:Metal-dependent hydrolase YbeY, involved in rRNA and/or ribosome maturation and assembly [hydrothermal vent metagenome]|uniref:Metal-dependent hydrolase YbeY, involved in rRNA and/or ribosome maturation and assembly n=1 Tax=hydrothermal vent metagenome TaxID=652676 RepID=A0A1W1CRQ8_9ZZZZ